LHRPRFKLLRFQTETLPANQVIARRKLLLAGPLAAAGCAGHGIVPATQGMPSLLLPQGTPVPREALAFYYGWHAHPDWADRVRFVPRGGAYASTDPAVVERQAAQAAAAGLTGLIASWWPQRDRNTDAQLPLLLAAASRHGLAVAALVEAFGEHGDDKEAPASREAVLSDLDYVLTRHARHPAWLRVAGRPVLFLYVRALRALPDAAAWNEVLAALRARHPPGVVLLADNLGAHRGWPQLGAAWDTLFNYDFGAQALAGLDPARIAAVQAKRYRKRRALVPRGRLFALTVGPGYDDTRTGRPLPRPIVDRWGGETYRVLWRAALAENPDWVLVTSWNEWAEGTEIEPSREFGDAALRDTAVLAGTLRARPPRLA